MHSNAHSQQPSQLELHIPTNCVGLYPQPPATITSDMLAKETMTIEPPNPTTSPTDFTLYHDSGEESKWLVDIAHDICDPTMKCGLLKVWDVAGLGWRDVNATDHLTASIYLYHIQVVVSLSKISLHTCRSVTSASGNASTMANRVKQRDGEQCWVSGMPPPLVNSHVCPKRMGDHLLRIIYGTFQSPPPTLSIYDEICGISLSPTLDIWFDAYELGLRYVAPDVYDCHSFLPSDCPPGQIRTILGPFFTNTIPQYVTALPSPLHGWRIHPPQPQHPHNPPPGLIRWHYLQCVLKKFAHSDYRNLQNIQHYELPLRMKGDSDEGTDSEYEWPSAALDRGRAMKVAIEHHQENQRLVEDWVTATLD
ncbi:hypothetical protein F5888DRAFT_1613509 [Russula emetica]|nr:hypothetical protein F5888DRAFT_1613509 [Russula emetica]